MSKDHLRAVAPGEKSVETAEAKTLTEAVKGGSYLEILLAQQHEIASTVGDEKGPAKAALHRQLALISKEIEALRVKAKQEADEDGDSATEDAAFDASAV